MKYHEKITLSEDFNVFLTQYLEFYESIGKRRAVFKTNNIYIYDPNQDVGSGSISVFRVFEDIMITIYDYEMKQDLKTFFEFSSDYFELEYCLSGSMLIETLESKREFKENQLSISMNEKMHGSINRQKGVSYRGVSIVSQSDIIKKIFEDEGQKLWENTVDKLSLEQRYKYYFGEDTSMEIANAFKQMVECRLPYQLRSMYYESKVMEILILIISKEVITQENIKQTDLTKYEIEQIQRVPHYLIEQRHELPTLKELSEAMMISEEKLSSGFKLMYEDTIFSYHRKHIIKRGAEMLIHTQLSVDEISIDLGYSNASNFVVAFKKYYEMTPLKYREQSLLHHKNRN